MQNGKILCLVWGPFSARMDEISREIGGKRFNLSILYGHKYLAPLRYIVLSFMTIYLLIKERPDVIYAQNPPIFCPLACLPYCKLTKKKLLIDHHAVWSIKTFRTGILGRIIGRIERFVVSNSFLNTAPHTLWENELKKIGARNVITIYDYVQSNRFVRDEEVRKKYSSGRRFLALAPHGGHPLERIEDEAEAVRSINSLTLLISGSEAKLKSRIDKMNLADNVKYIGFLDNEEYERLKASVDIGLCITDEPYTISHSLLEFAASSVPIISSEQQAVRELFGDSIMYVKSSPESVREAIKIMIEKPEVAQDYVCRIKKKQEELLSKRREQVERLKSLLQDSRS